MCQHADGQYQAHGGRPGYPGTAPAQAQQGGQRQDGPQADDPAGVADVPCLGCVDPAALPGITLRPSCPVALHIGRVIDPGDNGLDCCPVRAVLGTPPNTMRMALSRTSEENSVASFIM